MSIAAANSKLEYMLMMQRARCQACECTLDSRLDGALLSARAASLRKQGRLDGIRERIWMATKGRSTGRSG